MWNKWARPARVGRCPAAHAVWKRWGTWPQAGHVTVFPSSGVWQMAQLSASLSSSRCSCCRCACGRSSAASCSARSVGRHGAGGGNNPEKFHCAATPGPASPDGHAGARPNTSPKDGGSEEKFRPAAGARPNTASAWLCPAGSGDRDRPGELKSSRGGVSATAGRGADSPETSPAGSGRSACERPRGGVAGAASLRGGPGWLASPTRWPR